MENILRTILYEWQTKKLPETVERDIKVDLNENSRLKKAVVITGFRRTGKTYLLFTLASRLKLI